MYSPHNLAILLNINFVLFSTYCFAVAVVSFSFFYLWFRIWFFSCFSPSPLSRHIYLAISTLSSFLGTSLSLSLSLPRLLPTNLYISHLLMLLLLLMFALLHLLNIPRATSSSLSLSLSASSPLIPCHPFSSKLFLLLAYFFVILTSMSVEKDLGRSMGRPRARSQMREASTPRARETPNNTV